MEISPLAVHRGRICASGYADMGAPCFFFSFVHLAFNMSDLDPSGGIIILLLRATSSMLVTAISTAPAVLELAIGGGPPVPQAVDPRPFASRYPKSAEHVPCCLGSFLQEPKCSWRLPALWIPILIGLGFDTLCHGWTVLSKRSPFIDLR